MNKKELKKLVYLGIAAGLITTSSQSVQAEGPSIDANTMEQYMLARPACKGPNGCGGFTASRDLSEGAEEEESEDENAKNIPDPNKKVNGVDAKSSTPNTTNSNGKNNPIKPYKNSSPRITT